jgi:hypothetical protein
MHVHVHVRREDAAKGKRPTASWGLLAPTYVLKAISKHARTAEHTQTQTSEQTQQTDNGPLYTTDNCYGRKYQTYPSGSKAARSTTTKKLKVANADTVAQPK